MVALSAVVGCGAVLLGIAIDLAPLEGLVVALSAVVGCGRLRRCLIDCNRPGSVRGSGGCVVGCCRLRRCLMGNCNRSGSVRGCGGCVVGCCRLWSAAALSYWELQ